MPKVLPPPRKDGTPQKGRAAEVRDRILEAIHHGFGFNETSLARLADVSRGRLRHHLVLLEETGAVQRLSIGRQSHYFPREFEERDIKAVAATRHREGWRILREVLVEPGLTQTELAERVHVTGPTLRAQCRLLQEAGILAEIRRGRTVRYLPGRSLDDRLCGLMGLPVLPEKFGSPTAVAALIWRREHPLRPPSTGLRSPSPTK